MIARRSPEHHRLLARLLEPVWLRKFCRQHRPHPANDVFDGPEAA